MDKCRYKDINALLDELEIRNAPKSWYNNWEASMSAYPGEDIFFLSESYVAEANCVLNLKYEKLEAFNNALAVIRASAALCHLAWLWYHVIYFGNQAPDEIDMSTWPVPVNSMGSCSDMLHAVVLIAGIPLLDEFYRARKIPHGIFIETLSDLEICMEEYKEKFGVYGVGLFRMEWLLKHFTGKLFRLGRLQFIYKKFNEYLRIFRNIRSGEVVALCETGVEFTSNGEINGSNDIFYDSGTWKSEYCEDGEYICGNPVLPSGRPIKEKARLERNEWETVLSEGDGLLDVHIPSGAPLDYASCQKSYTEAMKFFSTYFPELVFKGFTCCSWLLTSELRLLIPEDSNIIKFQKDYYLYPALGDDSVFEYVFGSKPDDLSRLPEHTSLQRSVKKHILGGNSLNSYAGIILKV